MSPFIERCVLSDYSLIFHYLIEQAKNVAEGTRMIYNNVEKYIDIPELCRPLSLDQVKSLTTAMKSNTRCSILCVNGTDIGDDGIKEFMDVLKVNETLLAINLGDCNITIEGINHVCAQLKKKSSLEWLFLHNNGIQDNGAIEIASMLETNTRLSEIGLSYNLITSLGVEHISRSLHHNTCLRYLHLEENQIGDPGARHLAEMLKVNTTLTHLMLCCNNITDVGVGYLAESLEENQSLFLLFISKNRIKTRGAKALADALRVNQSLALLSVLNNDIGDDGRLMLCEALLENDSMMYMEMDQLKDDSEVYGIPDALFDQDKLMKEKMKQNLKTYIAKWDELIGAADLVNKVPWMRSKLMVVGQGGAGKTATVRSLLGEEFEPKWISTVGAEVTQTKTKVSLRSGDSPLEYTRWGKSSASKGGFTEDAASRFMALKLKERESSLGVLKKPSVNKLMGKKDTSQGPITEMKASDVDYQEPEPKSRSALESDELTKQIARIGERDDGDLKMKKYDHSILLRSKDIEETMNFTIWDYGGQTVFYTLHHLFLTNYGVYLLVFDMREALTNAADPKKYLKFWLDSIKMHAPSAPILLVGTYMDDVDSREDLTEIQETFNSCGINRSKYPQIVDNPEDEMVTFFPISNKRGNGIEKVRMQIEKVTRIQKYIHFEVPIKWMRCLDSMMEHNWISLEDTKEIGRKFSVNSIGEILEMLHLFNELGVIVHITSTSALSNVITTNPQWLVDQISKVIRHHELHTYQEGKLKEVGLEDDGRELFESALASEDLLLFHWGYQHLNFFIDFMRRTCLLSVWKFKGEVKYLIPSMLRNEEGSEHISTLPTCDSGERYLFDFSSSSLPVGVFQRLVCLCVAHSGLKGAPERPVLYKNSAYIWFGTGLNESVHLKQVGDTILLNLKSKATAYNYFKIISSMLLKLKADIMGEGLTWSITQYSEAENEFLPLKSTSLDEWSSSFQQKSKSQHEGTTVHAVGQGMELDRFLDLFS